MCGFAAMIALGGGQAARATVDAMAATLVHRGPDDEGSYVDGAVALGFRRLAILDLAPTGHQPMISSDGQVVLVFNGEIYNYVELREELMSLGHVFTSSGDTQVLLAAYRQWGRDCLPRLNGMWAFLIHDRRSGTIFGSRDRFGVKPLYRYRTADAVFLASEIKAIHASGRYTGGPNWPRVAAFLLDPQLEMQDSGGDTFHVGIEEIPAGSAFELRLDGRMTEWRYWSLPLQTDLGPADPPRVCFETLADAVRLRTRSDVPVGVSLSGGLDSTAIICHMATLRAQGDAASRNGALQAFSYITPELDESIYIEQTIERTKAVFHRVHVDPIQLWDQLDRVLWYQDEPVHSLNVLIGFDIWRLAARYGVKVMLNGGGADETLAGYFSYFPVHWRALCKTDRTLARSEIEAYSRTHGGDVGDLYRSALRQACRSQLWHFPGYGRLAGLRRRHGLRKTRWFTDDIRDAAPSEHAGLAHRTLDSSLRWSVEHAPLPYYLRVDDRNSMAQSVELRSPFLDYRLVSLAFQLPAEWKLRGPWNKYVLREALRGHIPDSVRLRPDKMGFPAPIRQWVRGPLYAKLQDLLASREIRERGLYRVEAIRQDLDRHRTGEIDVSNGLLAIAQVEHWLKQQEHSRQRDHAAAGRGR